MSSKIKVLGIQTDYIYEDDYLLLDREGVPLRMAGEDYKKFCSEVMNSPVNYYKEPNVPCSTKDDVYILGLAILNSAEVDTGVDNPAFGVPIRLHEEEELSEEGWMFHTPGSPNKITISLSDRYEEYEEGDNTALSKETLLQTLYCLIPGTENLAYTINILEGL